MPKTQSVTVDTAILGRLVKLHLADFPLEVGEALLNLDFGQEDSARMRELAVKGQEGSLTKEEKEELHTYRAAGQFVDLIREDSARMRELAVKGKEGRLTKKEEEVLDLHRYLGYLVDLMRLNARMILKTAGNDSNTQD